MRLPSVDERQSGFEEEVQMRYPRFGWAVALVVGILCVLMRPDAALAGVPHPRNTQVIASEAGLRWSTPSERGRAVEVEPHPAWPNLDGAAWVWRTTSPRNEVVTFKRAFYVPRSARKVSGVLHITTDNAYQVFLNGKPVGANGPFDFNGPDEATWATIFQHTITPKKGWNVLKVRAINYFGPAEPPDNPAGLIFRLDLSYTCPGRSGAHS
jgi:hypothetical protein